MNKSCALIALFAWLSYPVFAFADGYEPVTVEVEGFSAVVGDKKDAARQGALHSAFRRAVEQVVGVVVESRTTVKNTMLINDRILSKSSGFIKNYRVLDESCEHDSCRVRIKTTVSSVRLVKGLEQVGILSRKLGNPRVAVIIGEQLVGTEAPSAGPGTPAFFSGVAQSVIHDSFARKGYNLVDKDTLVAIARNDKAIAGHPGIMPSDVEALQVAVGGGAEVAIIGQAVARASATVITGTNMRTTQATVSARAVDADTGHMLGSHSASGSVAHVNPAAGGVDAIRKAAQEVADQLNRQIQVKWSQKTEGTRTVSLLIKGISFDEIGKIRELMREQVTHVEETTERNYRDGTLQLEAEITSSARELAEELAASGLGGMRWKVVSLSGNSMQLQLLKP